MSTPFTREIHFFTQKVQQTFSHITTNNTRLLITQLCWLEKVIEKEMKKDGVVLYQADRFYCLQSIFNMKVTLLYKQTKNN